MALFSLLYVEGVVLTLMLALTLGLSKVHICLNTILWPIMLPILGIKLLKKVLPLLQMFNQFNQN